MTDHVVILAGGTGTRLWPASVRLRPKQFMDPGTGRTLIESTLVRAEATGARGEVVVVTHVDQVTGLSRFARSAGTSAPASGGSGRPPVVLAEPQAKNTAPAVALAISYLARTPGRENDTVLVLAADHVITPTDAFVRDVERADQLARMGHLVTFGIRPTRAETGYGYIHLGEPVGPGRRVDSFKEKPNRETAEAYLADGGYLWNSGMFVFQLSTMWEELVKFEPGLASLIAGLPWSDPVSAAAGATAGAAHPEGPAAAADQAGIRTAGDHAAIAAAYLQLPRVSIDYAVMERSDRTAVVEAGFDWNDVGSWDEMAKLQEEGLLTDEIAPGEAVARTVSVESSGNYVFSDLPVALCGVEDLCVVVKNGRVLVCRRGRSQLVKEAVDQLEREGRADLV